MLFFKVVNTNRT